MDRTDKRFAIVAGLGLAFVLIITLMPTAIGQVTSGKNLTKAQATYSIAFTDTAKSSSGVTDLTAGLVAKGSCSEDQRGLLTYELGPLGIADQLNLCHKTAQNTYVWSSIPLP